VAEDLFGIVGTLQAGAFRVERVVAEGGFAVIYQAHHEGFRAKVALKCLKIPGSFSEAHKASFLEKFRAEGELLFQLSALIAAVVRPLHVGTIDNEKRAFVPFIALEWLEGETLDALIARRRAAGKQPLDLTRVVRLLGPVARALECAHKFPGPDGTQLSILHRDLKPENLFIAKVHGQEAAKILDFGIGTVKSVATQIVGRMSSEQGGLSAFTPAYGAPEQWLPKRFGQTGSWTDVWGFALCAVELLSGRTPFDGDAHALMGACIDEQRRPTPRNSGVRVPDAVEAAFERALAVDPKRRYRDIGEFWDEVEAAVGVRTPRIVADGQVVSESVAPPADAGVVPDLTLPVPVPSARSQGKVPQSAPDFSLVRNDALELDALAVQPRGPGKPVRAELRPQEQFELDSTGPRPSARLQRPRPRRAIEASPGVDPRATEHLMMRLRPSLTVLLIGVGLTIGDFAFAAISGAPFSLGPVRVFWVAAPLVVLGLFRLLHALLSA